MTKSSEVKVKKERVAIYMVREHINADDEMVKLDNAKSPIEIKLNRGTARLYIKKEPPKPPPPWTNVFTSRPEVPDDAFGSTNSVGAVLVLNLERIFLLSFGHGFHLIKDESVERDFGLRVTLNSVEPGKLRSLDKANYDHNPLNSRTQSPRDVDIFDLDMDSESQMLYAVTGASREPIFGSHVTGRDALTINVAVDFDGILLILDLALKKYQERLPDVFSWVDNINRVRNQDEIDLLDLYLNDELADESQTAAWLGEPEIVDWESQIGYSFDLRERTPRHVVLELADLREYLSKNELDLTVDVLKEQSVHINNTAYQSTKCWTAYRCLYAEIDVGEGHFILRNGLWYKVRAEFVEAIDHELGGIKKSTIVFPIYSFHREEDYNEDVAKNDSSFLLMDQKNTKIGGPYDKIEFCDLIKDQSSLIHVKFYRSSSTLSHLFAQGNVASETFIKDEEFRTKLNEKLPPTVQLADPSVQPNAAQYTIVYAIATVKKIPSELPFFAKITLKNAVRTLRALHFNVELATIDVDPNLLVTKKIKPKK